MHDTESTVCTLYSLDLYVKITTQPLGIASPIRWLSLVYPLLLCVVSGLHVTRASRQNNASGGYMKPSTTPIFLSLSLVYIYNTVQNCATRVMAFLGVPSWRRVMARCILIFRPWGETSYRPRAVKHRKEVFSRIVPSTW
jgi:hypothetical protein